MKGICKLCLKSSELCKSHIISELFYKPLYDDKHRMILMNTDPSQKLRYEQKGFREYLLCNDCEQKLNKWEVEADRVFFHKTDPVEINENIFTFKFENPDKIRLLFLSILWRMSISTLELFSVVDLGPHEEIFREMIFDENPGDYFNYAITATAVFHEGRFITDLITEPDKTFTAPHRIYRIVITGFYFCFFIAKFPLENNIRRLAFQPDGTWIIPAMEVRKIPSLAFYFEKHAKAQKIRNKK